ncbi:hypothetical protein [Pseudomonas frederiksbergensis]|uniref:hypothetical protein n=1 Tax=Pseudomonas frederiksbergensis TaxID=104087 RepID=UPI000F4A6129|nr:hypothetical protein [Pseudomonas frederiksbergensis]RON56318.1 hypothetical protein BK667_08220 [Pseudomonas frederiksbergensis]
MKFQDIAINHTEYFSIGQEADSGKFYLSIPVSNGLVDYEEYYEIDKLSFDQYLEDSSKALDFVEQCRNRRMDHLLMFQTGSDRGSAC